MSSTKTGENTDARRDWVIRVLGVTPPTSATNNGGLGAAERMKKLTAIWDAAIERVDGQIGALQKVLRTSGDDDLKAIAEFGLSGVTGNHKVKIMAALIEARAGTLSEEAAARAAAVVADFRTHIASDARIAACDQNPFGATVAIRATLEKPLALLEAALRATSG